MNRSIARWLPSLGAVLSLGLASCGDAALAGAPPRSETYALPKVAAGLLGQERGVRVRYQGPASTMGFRYVVLGPGGAVERVQPRCPTVS